MTNKIDWSRKPPGQTILGQVAERLARRKAGLDPLTPEEREKAERERKEGARNFDKYCQDLDK